MIPNPDNTFPWVASLKYPSTARPRRRSSRTAADRLGIRVYAVDYRHNMRTFYLPDSDSLVLEMPQPSAPVAVNLKAAVVKRLVRWAQAGAADYSFVAVSRKAKDAGRRFSPLSELYQGEAVRQASRLEVCTWGRLAKLRKRHRAGIKTVKKLSADTKGSS